MGHATNHAASQRATKSPEMPVLMAVMTIVMKNDMTQDMQAENATFANLAGTSIQKGFHLKQRVAEERRTA